jgi:beta-glucanase (GH16 family)
MEGGGSHPASILQTVHFGDNQQVNRNVDGPDFSAGYHTFGVDWEPNAISWYVDGARRWGVRVSISKRMYVLANLAVLGLTPSIQLRSPASLAIDYVRVWQHPS